MAEMNDEQIQKFLENFQRLNPQAEKFLALQGKINNEFAKTLSLHRENWPREKAALEQHIKQIKLVSGPDGLAKFASAIRSGNAGMEQYKQQLQALDAAIEQLAATTDDAEAGRRKQELQTQRMAMESKIAMAEFNAKVLNTGKVLASNLGSTAAKATGDFVKGLTSGSSATELSSTMMNSAVDAAAAGAGALTGAMQGGGQILQSSTNPKLRMLGTIADVTGGMLGSVAEGASKLAKFGIDILSKEVEKTVKAFNATSAAGAMFTDGMTGMRKAAGDSGLTIEQFSNVVKENSQTLAQSGLGVTAGAKQIGAAMKAGGDTAKRQLLNLGYSFEEQAGLYAETAANMRRSAGGKASDQQIADQTAKYAENLRIISAITGEDAKRKTEEARSQNQILAFQQEMAKKTPEQRAQIDAAMATMTEAEKKNFRDRAVLGTVINKEGAIYEATVAGAKEKGEAQLALLNNNQMTADANAKLNSQYGDQITDSINGNKSLGVASYVAGGSLQEVGKIMLDSVNQSLTYTADAVKAGKEAVEQQKKTNDEMTTSVTNAAIAAQGLKIAIENELIGPMKDFAKVTESMLTAIQKMVSDATGIDIGGKKEEGLWDKAKRVGGAALSGATTGATIGGTALAGAGTVALPGVGTVAGGTAGVAGGAIIGGLVGAIKEAFWGQPGKAKGGISSGPASGYMEKLHGTEAVVPLEGGRSIPVSLNVNELIPKPMLTMLSKLGNLTKDLPTTATDKDTPTKLTYALKSSFESLTGPLDKLQSFVQPADPARDSSMISKSLSGPFDKLQSFLQSADPARDSSMISKSLSGPLDKLQSFLQPLKNTSGESAAAADATAMMADNLTSMRKAMALTLDRVEKPASLVQPIENGRGSNAMPLTDFSAVIADVMKNKNTAVAKPPTEPFQEISRAAKSTNEPDSSSLIQEQLSILREIKDTLDNSRDLQQQYVNNSYS